MVCGKKMIEELERSDKKENSNLVNERIKDLNDNNKISENKINEGKDSNIITKS